MHSRLSLAAALATALGLALPAAAAPVMVPPPSTSLAKLFEFEVKVKPPRPGRADGQMEGKLKWEQKVDSRELKFERNLKLERLPGVPTTLPFLFSAQPLADGGLRLGLTFGDYTLAPLDITAAQAAAVPMRLLQLEIEAESRSKIIGRAATANGLILRLNDRPLVDLVSVTAPVFDAANREVDDEAKTRLFFARPGGVPYGAPLTLTGFLSWSEAPVGELKEAKLKGVFGNAAFTAPPADQPPGSGAIAVVEPASFALLAASLVVFGLVAQRRGLPLGDG